MSAEAALQKAIYAALVADAGVGALAGDRIYDDVPASASKPYVVLGDMQAIEDGSDCVDAVEVFATLHVWSDAVGAVEARQVVGAVRDALHEAELTLDDPFALALIEHRDSRTFADANPKVTHGVVVFRALVERAD